MRIYVASSWRNLFQNEVVSSLRSAGYEVYDFKGSGDGWGGAEAGPGGFAWSEIDFDWQSWPQHIDRYVEGLKHPRAVEGFDRDMNALRRSDACVMVMPCGPSASMEMGWACGSGLPTAVYIPAMREPDLMVGMAGLVTQNWRDVLLFLDRSSVAKATTYWFGCGNHSAGHYMEASPYNGRETMPAHDFLYRNPWGLEVDSGLCPKRVGEREGSAQLHHKAGWTALAFWDRSGYDHRPGCNSCFIAEGTLSFAAMMAAARHHFPLIVARLLFEVHLA